MPTWARLLDYYLPLLLLVLALAALLAAPRLYRLWMESQEDGPATGEDLLEDFEEAHAAGALGDEELRRVRELLRGPDGLPEQRRSPPPAPPPADPPGDAAPPTSSVRETPDAAPRSTASEPPEPPPAGS